MQRNESARGEIMQQANVLLVEDDKQLRKTLSRYLGAHGYLVFEAGTFREALDQMSVKPDLMVLDIHLPDATGWDVAEWLETQTSRVPVIMMSGVTRPSPRQVEHFHIKAFLQKPFPIEQLLDLVERNVPVV